MNDRSGTARRYHWLSEGHNLAGGLASFVDAPHTAIEGRNGGEIVNLADRRAAASRRAQLDLLADLRPDRLAREVAALAAPSEAAPAQAQLPHLALPANHSIRSGDVILRRLHATLAAAAECGPKDFPELLLVAGVGARTIHSLAMVAEVIHGAPCRFADPARFSLALGGKDGHPFPVPIQVYDKTIGLLKSALSAAKLGSDEKLAAIRRLDAQARRLESHASGPGLDAHIAEERQHSHQYGGRSIFGWEPPVDDGAAG